jgi:probable F420-dependent oxidoreductase
MQFGVHLPHFANYGSTENIRRVAVAAEDLGYDSVWVSDHVVAPKMVLGYFGASFWEPLTVLTYAAAVTKKVRLGTSVIIVPYRDPLVTAKTIATIDQLSGGRVIFGAASGWLEPEFQALGQSFAERGEQTDEYLRIYKEAWTSEDPDFRGRYRTFSDLKFEPKPVQKPYPPLWIGGMSKRAIRRAVEFGDGWQPVRTSLADTKACLETLHRVAERSGRKLDAFTISIRLPTWFADSRGFDDGQMITTADDMASRLDAYRQLGVSDVLVDFFLGIPHPPGTGIDSFLGAMERFRREVRTKLE